MRDEAWGDVEQAFFAAGDAYGDTPADESVFVCDEEDASPAPSLRQRLEPALLAAARWTRWHARLLEFRVAVAVSAGAEHALRTAAIFRFRPLMVLPRLRPRVIMPRPWLVRASVVVLISSVANYSFAAVLAAAGAL